MIYQQSQMINWLVMFTSQTIIVQGVVFPCCAFVHLSFFTHKRRIDKKQKHQSMWKSLSPWVEKKCVGQVK